MKKFAINSVSSLMTAAVLVGAAAMMPAKANAGDAKDIAAGVFGVIILNEILNPNNNNRSVNAGVTPNGRVYGNVNADNYPRHGHGHTTIINNYPRDCGFVQNISRHPGYNIITTRDRCTGQIISERTVYNRRHGHYNNW